MIGLMIWWLSKQYFSFLDNLTSCTFVSPDKMNFRDDLHRLTVHVFLSTTKCFVKGLFIIARGLDWREIDLIVKIHFTQLQAYAQFVYPTPTSYILKKTLSTLQFSNLPEMSKFLLTMAQDLSRQQYFTQHTFAMKF